MPAESAIHVCSSHGDASITIGSPCNEDSDQCITRCRMEKFDVGCLADDWKCGAGHDLSRLQSSATTASEELACSDSSRRRLYCCIEREAGRGIVACGLIGGNR